jgi:hypothetical protein
MWAEVSSPAANLQHKVLLVIPINLLKPGVFLRTARLNIQNFFMLLALL